MDTDTARLVTDITGLEQLKTKAREDQSAALGEVSRQFESLLVDMMVKSMRQASLGDSIMDSSQSLMYRDMYDQQLSAQLAQRGIGLAEMIQQQLGGSAEQPARTARGVDDYRRTPVAVAAAIESGKAEPADGNPEPLLDSPRRFVETLLPMARDAAQRMGIAPEALLAQAALETGWGRSVIHGSGGDNSHNLFGIKADHRWEGDKVSVSTLEYADGVAVRRKDPFRAYDSYADSFQDYVNFLQGGSRYQQALASADNPRAYFSALQEAGYATDPAYADKIMRVLEGHEMQTALGRLKVADGSQANAPSGG